MMTKEEREKALYLLNKSRQIVLEAVDGVTDAQARWRPASVNNEERWTILEYAEHLAISDDALTAMVKRILLEPPREETAEERAAREERTRTPMPRGVNKAPAAIRPTGRFASLPDAVTAFLAARERTIAYTTTCDADLDKHFAPHTVLGPLNAYQWLVANARHAESHAGHIREIRQMEGYPPA